MKDYIKLAKIKYNNKEFIIFIDDDHNKTFLEVKHDKYYYPILEDIINLKLILNDNKRLYTKKYRFKEKIYSRLKKNSPITNFMLGVIIGVTATCSYKLIKERYPLFGYSPDQIIKVTDNNQLYELDIEEVTFKDVVLTLLNNKNIEGKYRDYTLEYISALEERLPDADLRIFNENLKELRFEIVPVDEWEDPGIDGFYDYTENYICLKDKYDDESAEKSVVFHELTHTTNSAVYTKVKIDDRYYKIKKTYQDVEKEYGRGTMEALTEIITDYLLSSNYEYYFDYERHSYRTYRVPASNVYQLLQIADNYSLYDYFTGDIYRFEESISEYELENILPLIDLEIAKDDEVIEIEEEYDLSYYQSILYKTRFKKVVEEERDVKDNSELTVFKKLKSSSLVPFKDKLEIIDNIYNNSFVDIEFSKETFPLIRKNKVLTEGNKIITNTIEYNGSINIEVYDGENNIINGEPGALFFYKDSHDKYKVGYREVLFLPVGSEKMDLYYDAATNVNLRIEEDKIIFMYEFLEYFMGIDGTEECCYNIKIDMSKIDDNAIRNLNIERILKMNKTKIK